jgi:hypothetical protein
MQANLGKSVEGIDTPLTRYRSKYSRPSAMWDEIAVAAFLDASIITDQE